MTVESSVEVNQGLGRELWVPCASCNIKTRHLVLASAEVTTDVNEGFTDLTVWEEFQIVQCRGCDSISFRKNYRSTEEFDEKAGPDSLLDHEELYPPRVAGRAVVNGLHLLPAELRAIYLESHKALCSQQPVLAGIGMRALIERVCKDKGSPGANLAKQIDGLVAIGVLTKSGADILHSLRTMGNQAAHEVKPHAEEELGTAFDVVDHLLLGVYILPARASVLPGNKGTAVGGNNA